VASPASSRPTRWWSTTSPSSAAPTARSCGADRQGRPGRVVLQDVRHRPRQRRDDGGDAGRSAQRRAAAAAAPSRARRRCTSPTAARAPAARRPTWTCTPRSCARPSRRAAALQAKTYIQFGSQRIRDYAEKMGYVQLFESAGVELIDPSCGACIKAGPGVSFTPTRSRSRRSTATSPAARVRARSTWRARYVVVASAFLGYVGGPDEL
jgi:hypothetical protein